MSTCRPAAGGRGGLDWQVALVDLLTMTASPAPREEAMVTQRLARQQNAFVITFALLLALLVGGYFYTVRVNDVQQLRQAEYEVCTARNANVDAIRQSLLLIAEGQTDGSADEIRAAAAALRKGDCQDFLAR